MAAWNANKGSVDGRKSRCRVTTTTIRAGGSPRGGFFGSKNLQNIWPELTGRSMRLPIMPCDYCMAKYNVDFEVEV